MEVCLLLAVWWNSTKMSELSANHWSFADESRRVVVSRGSRGRVVKAMDSKSIGVSPRRFESYRLRALLGRRTFIL